MLESKEIYGIDLVDSSILKDDFNQAFYLIELGKHVDEVFILSTCQRYVIFAYCSSVEELIAAAFQVYGEVKINMKLKSVKQSAEYLFSTATGIKSKVFGESEIMSQLRKQYKIALRNETVGINLNEFLGSAIKCGKLVRSQTNIGAMQISYVSLAIKKIEDLAVKNIKDMRCLVVGTGQLATQVVKALLSIGTNQIAIASHSNQRAKMVAEKLGVNALKIDQLSFDQYDLVVGCTHGEIDFMYHFSSKDNCPRHLIGDIKDTIVVDFGRPQNFPVYKQLNSKNYIGLDEIIVLSNNSMDIRKDEAPKVKQIVENEVIGYLQRYKHRKSSPLLGGYWRKLQEIQQHELDWLMRKYKFEEKEEELLRKFSHRILRKISKDTFVTIRQMAEEDQLDETKLSLLTKTLIPKQK